MKVGDTVRAANGDLGQVMQIYPVLERNQSWQVDAVCVKFQSNSSTVIIAATEIAVVSD
ncbi:MAG: hypothetical protein H0U85_09660 [Gemmatimonadales bacterium]|nr:hypothetical protein [Gemmatimonadales bacterium]